MVGVDKYFKFKGKHKSFTTNEIYEILDMLITPQHVTSGGGFIWAIDDNGVFSRLSIIDCEIVENHKTEAREYPKFEQNEPITSDNKLKGLEFGKMKQPPRTLVEVANETIENNEIYKEVKRLMNEAQITQVSYGLDKYPEPLNYTTWRPTETIDHIISETIDKLHYLTMLKIQLKKLEDERVL